MARPRNMSEDNDDADGESAMQGKRTNVQFYMDDDLDAAFDSAQTPKTIATATNENRAPHAATSSKQIRFSLGSNVEDGEDLSLKGGILKIVRESSKRASMSSAELSPVSTAPPSANRSVTQLEEARNANESETDDPYPNETSSPVAPFPPHDDDTIASDHEDDNTEGDDFVPPPPPESPERFEEEEIPTQVGSPTDFATQTDETSIHGDDNDDDDDKEGVGFNMAGGDESEPEDEHLKHGATRDRMASKSKPIVSQTLESPRPHSDDSDHDSLRPVKNKNKDTSKNKTRVDEKTVVDTEGEDGSDNDSMKQKMRLKKNRKSKHLSADEVNDDSTSQSNRKTRGSRTSDTDDESSGVRMKKKNKSRKRRSAHTSDEESVMVPKKKQKNDKLFSAKGYPLPRTYTAIPVSDVKDSPEDIGLRRSRRAKIKPLEFWRNERIVYGPNDFDDSFPEDLHDMPVPIQISKADPTPYKERKVTQKAPASSRKKQKKAVVVETPSEEEEFDSSKLRKKYKYIDSEEAMQWDECLDDSELTRVVAYSESLVSRDLPGSKGVSCRAAQAFNVQNDENVIFPSYIMGNLVVPPKGLKDSEAVGSCAQTFTVLSCQPKALEVAFGDPDGPEGVLDPKTAQRFLLRAGDMFRVTPGNCYRIKNHSKSKDAVLTWTIIRPFMKSEN